MSRLNVSFGFLSYCLIIIMMTSQLIHGVSYDYYFSSLRTEKNCNNLAVIVNCQIKCGVDAGLCIDDNCYCLTLNRLKNFRIKAFRDVLPKVLKLNEDEHSYSDFHEYDEQPEILYKRRSGDSALDEPEYLDEILLQDRPVLRHHIAHFCPNLDVARTCIRTCMKEGKPAFCGKDHVCYCGHKYSNKDMNPKTNVSNVYAEFHDLYQKYFGPNYKLDLQV